MSPSSCLTSNEKNIIAINKNRKRKRDYAHEQEHSDERKEEEFVLGHPAGKDVEEEEKSGHHENRAGNIPTPVRAQVLLSLIFVVYVGSPRRCLLGRYILRGLLLVKVVLKVVVVCGLVLVLVLLLLLLLLWKGCALEVGWEDGSGYSDIGHPTKPTKEVSGGERKEGEEGGTQRGFT